MELGDVEAAAARIAGLVRRTPLLPLDGTPLLVKCEGFQATGSFKLRGASNAIAALSPHGVVCSSSGNHGQAVALAAARAGIRCTVVMTADATPFQRAAVAALGARIVVSPPGTRARNRLAAQIAEDDDLTYIPPYDDPLVMAGQGTVGLEIADDLPDVRRVVVPVGGGGLIAGVATALRGRLRDSVVVIGVEPHYGRRDHRRRWAGGGGDARPGARRGLRRADGRARGCGRAATRAGWRHRLCRQWPQHRASGVGSPGGRRAALGEADRAADGGHLPAVTGIPELHQPVLDVAVVLRG